MFSTLSWYLTLKNYVMDRICKQCANIDPTSSIPAFFDVILLLNKKYWPNIFNTPFLWCYFVTWTRNTAETHEYCCDWHIELRLMWFFIISLCCERSTLRSLFINGLQFIIWSRPRFKWYCCWCIVLHRLLYAFYCSIPILLPFRIRKISSKLYICIVQ